MLTPAALAKEGLEPTAVIAVPVLVCRKAHIKKARAAKKSKLPVGMTRLMPMLLRSMVRMSANTRS